MEEPVTQVIAVSNQKGGVAKTTTALTVAAQLAKLGQSVLAIDLDPQANMSMGLGINLGPGDLCSYDVLVDDRPLEAAWTATPHKKLPKLLVVPASRRLARAERELFGQVGFDGILREKIEETNPFDWVVIDCPPSLGVLTMNALVAANKVLVPVQCEYFSVSGLASLLDLVKVVKKRRNPDLVLNILPTLFDRRNGICRGVLKDLKSRFSQQLSEVVIDVDTRLREAAARGHPITIFAPRSRASRQYGKLTEELLSHVEN
jgi:chromosome partitioning protein